MIDLATIAEGVLREYLIELANDVVALDLMDEDPECNLLSNSDWDRVAEMITDAKVDIKVTIR